MKNFADYRRWKHADADSFSRTPVETLHLIGENGAADIQTSRKKNLERVTLHATGDWRKYSEARPDVVICGRENDSRTAACLLVTGLWVEGQPNQIATTRGVRSATRLRCQWDRRFRFRGDDFSE